VAFLWFPTLHAFRLGALTPILFLGIAGCWRLRGSRYEQLPLAAIIALKLFLWPLAFWYAARRGLRALAAAAILFVGILLLSWALVGFAGVTEYPALLRRLQDQWAPDGYGLGTVLHRAGLSNGALDAALLFVGLLLSTAVAQAVRARRLADEEALALFVGVAVVVSPVVWMHYLSLLVIPLALLEPALSAAWFLPLVLWLTPYEQSSGLLWRVELAMLVVVFSIVLALRRSRHRLRGARVAHAAP
jgi:hypothetical protein